MSTLSKPSPLRTQMYTLALSVWAVIMGSIMLHSYMVEQDSAFNELGLKTEVAFIQFERHWTSLMQEDISARNDYLRQLSMDFRPAVDLSVISSNGKILGSSLTKLDQLSYSPIVVQLQNSLALGNTCITALYGLLSNAVQACSYPYDENTLFISTAKNDAIFPHWLSEKMYFIIACVFNLGLVWWILLINHKQKRHAISEKTQYKDNLSKQDNDFRRLISNLPGILYRLNIKNQHLDYLSLGCYQLLGYLPNYFMDNDITPFDLIDKADKHEFIDNSQKAYASFKPYEMVYRIKTASGEYKWVLDRGRCYKTAKEEQFIEGVMLDITERELVRQQIEYLGIQDPLTELYNRFKFNDELVQAVSHAKQNNTHFAMLFIDLDRFKNINDSLGHQLGDRLLQKVAQRIQGILPKGHFLARMGGDEFVIIMHNINGKKEVEALASNINKHLRQVFRIDSYELRTSCSIGITLCPEHSQHSHVLWCYADTSMYQVKKRGGNSYQFFTQEMGDSVQHRINIEHSLMPAFEAKQFELFYQPQVDINTNELLGCEALIRWSHPELGNVSPVEFIPIAEETGFIMILGDWILEQSIIQLKQWQTYAPNFVMSINVSAIQINENFPNRVNALIKQYEVNPSSVELEITESLLMENLDYILPILNEVKALGVGFAIDDFGTGYSSLSYLRFLPIKKLKIDRAFIMNIEKNEDDKTMVKAIIAMSKSLNLIILAEGIETKGQLTLLQELSCERYQGYYFNRPINSKSFTSLYFDDNKNNNNNHKVS